MGQRMVPSHTGDEPESAGVSGHNRVGRSLAAAFRHMHRREPLMWVGVAIILVFSLTGVTKVTFDDALIRFFQSDVPAFDHYVEVSRTFSGDGADVIALFEADDLASPEVAAVASDFLLDAQFVPGVRAVISPFSLRIAGADGTAEPLYPYPPVPRAQMADRLDRAMAENPTLARLMARDRSAMLVILPITEPAGDAPARRRQQIEALNVLAAKASEAPGVRVRLSGYPVLRDTVNRALVRDVLVINGLGMLIGVIVAMVTFRSIRVGFMVIVGPAVSALMVLGMHGHMGIAINTITLTLPVLVLVLATSDSIHLTFERARQAGRDPARAAVRAVRRVAVACVFAALTTAIAFAALTTSRAEIIADLGRMGVIVTLASVVTVLLVQTVVFSLAARAKWFLREFDRLHDHMPSGLGLGGLPRLGIAMPRTVAWSAVAVLLVSTVLYSQAGPRYSLLDSLRESSTVITVFDAVEEKIAPVSQILVPVPTTDPEVVARVHHIVEAVTGSQFVQSVSGVDGGAEGLRRSLPEPLSRRLLSEDATRTVVSVPFRYVSGDDTIALADKIDAAIATDPVLRDAQIGKATGLPVMSARVAGVILDEINRSLLIALGGVVVLIYLWLRNLRIALLSLLPNMLPVTLIGAWLMLSGRGIEFSNGLALTVAFGIAVDDTLHVLNRLRLTGGVDRIERDRLVQAFREVAPALVTTSAVLILGMSGVFFAENRGVSEFGQIAMAVYALALLADLLVLPAALAVFGPRSYLRHRKERS